MESSNFKMVITGNWQWQSELIITDDFISETYFFSQAIINFGQILT